MMVTCNKCGWVHFEVSRKSAEEEVQKFNEYFDKLEPSQQQDFYNGKKSSIASYERCGLCGGSYKNFRESKEGDCPMGCTIGPIISKED